MQNDPSGSALRQSLLKSRIAKLPHLPAIAPGHSQNSDGASARISPLARPAAGEITEEDERQDVLPSLSAPRTSSRTRRNQSGTFDAFAPLTADDCFAEALEVEVDEANDDDSATTSKTTFRVYFTPPSKTKASKSGREVLNPAADISGRGASLAAVPLIDEEEEDDQADSNSSGTIFVLHHGAGYSALSFALVAKHISETTQGKVGVLAYDCRGHGRTVHASHEDGSKMSLETLTKDGLAILAKVFPPEAAQPTLILVGHSMGGAVVVSMAHALQDVRPATLSSRPKVAGVAVLDVVEGTAIEALPGMKSIVSQLPKGFATLTDAIRWHVDSGTIVNIDSARRSVPSLLRKNDAYVHGTHPDPTPEQEPMETLNDDPIFASNEPSAFPLIWRHDLLATEPHWRGWFEGLSAAFLSVKCARLLLLAGTDRLDKDLMIGQMQGKYQLVVFQDVGHSLQEDAPQRTAETLIEFWRRNEALDITAIRGIRKVGQA